MNSFAIIIIVLVILIVVALWVMASYNPLPFPPVIKITKLPTNITVKPPNTIQTPILVPVSQKPYYVSQPYYYSPPPPQYPPPQSKPPPQYPPPPQYNQLPSDNINGGYGGGGYGGSPASPSQDLVMI
jgi:hypothetical protein